MPEKMLERHEAEEIAKRFVKDHWGADENQTVIESVKFIYIGEVYVYEVGGSVSQSQLASDLNPYPGYFFHVQVSTKDGKVIGFGTQPFPEPQIVGPCETPDPRYGKYGLDPKKYGIDWDRLGI